MKIKDLETKKVVNEIKLGSFGLGDYGSALMKQVTGQGGGLTKQDLMTQNIYIKNFVSNALSNLNNAIKSGLVTPPKPPAKPQAQAPAQPQAQAPTQPQTQAPAQAQAQAPAPAQAQAQAPAQAPAQAQAQPQAPKGKTVPRQTVAQKVAAQKAAQKAAAQPKRPFAQKAAAAKQKQANIKAAGIKNQPIKVKESYYDRLNELFEIILEEVAPAPQENTQSIKDYLKTVWFPNYLKGVNWKPNEQNVDQLIQKVQDTYAKDNGRAALNQLASLSYSITPRKAGKGDASQSKAAGQKPSVATNTADKPATANNQTKPANQAAPKTGGKKKGELSNDPRAVRRRQATAAKRAMDAGLTVSNPNAQTQSAKAPITANWGGVKYTQTAKGWVDNKRRPADPNTAKILDQAVAKDKAKPPAKAKPPPAPTAGPASGAAQQDDSKIIQMQNPKKKTA